MRNAELKVHIQRVYDENLFVLGPPKIWAQLNVEGIGVARCTVERLIREMRVFGNPRGRTWTVTTDANQTSIDPPIWSIASSRRRHRTGCGLPTSAT